MQKRKKKHFANYGTNFTFFYRKHTVSEGREPIKTHCTKHNLKEELKVLPVDCLLPREKTSSHHCPHIKNKKVCLDCESNTGPSDLQSDALPTELSRHFLSTLFQYIES
jgi:hypothetical protein